jgi:hypothetical protein
MFNTECCWQTAQFYSPLICSVNKETNFKPICKLISVQDVHKYFGSRSPQVFRFKMPTNISVQDVHKYLGSRCPQVFSPNAIKLQYLGPVNNEITQFSGAHVLFLHLPSYVHTAVRSNDIPNWYSFGLRTLFYDLGLRHYKEKEYKRLRDEKTAYWWLMSAHDMWR